MEKMELKVDYSYFGMQLEEAAPAVCISCMSCYAPTFVVSRQEKLFDSLAGVSQRVIPSQRTV